VDRSGYHQRLCARRFNAKDQWRQKSLISAGVAAKQAALHDAPAAAHLGQDVQDGSAKDTHTGTGEADMGDSRHPAAEQFSMLFCPDLNPDVQARWQVLSVPLQNPPDQLLRHMKHEDEGWRAEPTALLVIGGSDGWSDLDSVEGLDLQGTPKWQPIGRMQFKRRGLAVVVLDGQIWAMGGRSGEEITALCEHYSPQTRAWSASVPMKYLASPSVHVC